MSKNISESLTCNLKVDFSEFIRAPNNPIQLLAEKIKRALQLGIREPLAIALATASSEGQPSIRTLVISEVSEQGIIFSSHSSSRKGKELAENPNAAALLYWRETSEQISIIGYVRELSVEDSTRIWANRPLFTHAMSVASSQSEPLEDIEELRKNAKALEELVPLERPKSFTGYELIANEIEFWTIGSERLHERLVYHRSGLSWFPSRLQP